MAKQKFTAEQVASQLRDSTGLVLDAAEKLECSPQTIYNYIERYPTVKAALENGRTALLDVAEAALTKQIRKGDTTAIIFYLKTQGKKRGYVERTENLNINVSPDLLQKLVAALEANDINPSDAFEEMIRNLANADATVDGKDTR